MYSDYSFFELAENIFFNWMNTLYGFFDWVLVYSFNIGGQTYSLFELMFGSLLIFYCTYTLISYVVDIAP